MEELHLAFSIIGGLIGMLTILVGWLGSRVINKLDDLDAKLDETTLNTHSKINVLDNRITRLEVMLKA